MRLQKRQLTTLGGDPNKDQQKNKLAAESNNKRWKKKADGNLRANSTVWEINSRAFSGRVRASLCWPISGRPRNIGEVQCSRVFHTRSPKKSKNLTRKGTRARGFDGNGRGLSLALIVITSGPTVVWAGV